MSKIKSLEDIWPEQSRLNSKAGIDTLKLGKLLAEVECGSKSDIENIRIQVGRALKNYVDALTAECHELHECLSWKHWYKEAKEGRQYELCKIQNARVEAIDMLFFWVSICQLLGLAPEDIYRLYSKKLEINIRRQDEDRLQSEQHLYEDENKEVQ